MLKKKEVSGVYHYFENISPLEKRVSSGNKWGLRSLTPVTPELFGVFPPFIKVNHLNTGCSDLHIVIVLALLLLNKHA